MLNIQNIRLYKPLCHARGIDSIHSQSKRLPHTSGGVRTLLLLSCSRSWEARRHQRCNTSLHHLLSRSPQTSLPALWSSCSWKVGRWWVKWSTITSKIFKQQHRCTTHYASISVCSSTAAIQPELYTPVWTLQEASYYKEEINININIPADVVKAVTLAWSSTSV